MSSGKKRVCIIGAGASGLAAMKECAEAGMIPVCLEMDSVIGGLWRFNPNEGHSSVARNTIINTSKEMMAYSDFPIPPHFPNFMPHTQIIEYFELYCKHFGLEKYIRFNHRVENVKYAKDYDSTGRIDVTYTNTVDNETKTETFDSVLVCSGHHWKPNWATFPGQEKFKGKIIHAHSFKDWQGFEDINVVVVGIGNSGLDIAVELSRASKHVYLSTRTGAWLMSRYSAIFDLPADFSANNRFAWWIPYNMRNTLMEKVTALETGDMARLKLKPKHRFLQAHPAINAELPGRVESGTVTIHKDIKEIKENSVVFENGEEVPCDAIIMATGYEIEFPFLDKSLNIEIKDNVCKFYKFIFPTNQKHPSVAFVGLIQPLGAIMPISEMQCRVIAQAYTGALKLPSRQEMDADVELTLKKMRERYVASKRHTIQVDYVSYMDELAKVINVYPGFWRVWKETFDLDLALKTIFGSVVPAQYRLVGKGKWNGAADQTKCAFIYCVYPVNPERGEKLLAEYKANSKKNFLVRNYRKILTLALIFYLVRRKFFSKF